MLRRCVSLLGRSLIILAFLAFVALTPAGCIPQAKLQARLEELVDVLKGLLSDEAAFRLALANSFALKKAKVIEETAFPSSKELLGAKEVRELGTGLWMKTIEYEAPDRLHYISSSEEGEFEAYRIGDRLIWRLQGPGYGGDKRWQETLKLPEELQQEVQWLRKVRGVDSLLGDQIAQAVDLKRLGVERVNSRRCVVLGFRIPSWDEDFKREVDFNGKRLKPVRYEVKAWVAKGIRPLLYKLEAFYIYKDEGEGTYDYIVETKTLTPDEKLTIRPPQ